MIRKVNVHATGAHADLLRNVHVYAGALDGEARLVGGRADTGGAWEYGRLEFRDRGFFAGLQEVAFGGTLGRRGAQVACW